jgi:transcriptional regulator with XRE-family HTH domain
MENESPVSAATTSSSMEIPPSTNLTSRDGLIQRLQRGPEVRAKFVESHLSKNLAFQLRSLRDMKEWTQGELAQRVGMPQTAISRLENPYYGKPTITSLKRLAAIYDVALIARFVPFSQLINYVTATPYEERGLRPEAMDIPPFKQEFHMSNVPLEKLSNPAPLEKLGSAIEQGKAKPPASILQWQEQKEAR